MVGISMECERSRLLEAISGLRHCVSLRNEGAFASSSLAFHTGEALGGILENRRKFEKHFGEGARFVSALQVHRDRIYSVVDAKSRGWEALDRELRADALITDLPRVVLTILTADCVPILLYDPLRPAIGAIHAGWRGSRLEIARRCIEEMALRYGSKPERIYAYIAPSIGGCCYEVTEEIAKSFSSIDGALSSSRNSGRLMLDLKRVNAWQLLQAGLKEEHIEISSICTACEVEHFFSYRAEGGCSGRFMSALMLEES